jgi:hypothetical protein
VREGHAEVVGVDDPVDRDDASYVVGHVPALRNLP